MTTYIKWNAKAINWKHWEFFNISLKVEDLAEHMNDKWYINITMSKRKEVWKYWDTHYLVLNEYKPQPKEDRQDEVMQSTRTAKDINKEISTEDLPW